MMTKSGRTIKPPSRLIEEMGVATSTMASVQNYYACLEEYDTDEVVLPTEVTNEESINGPDGEAWQAEVDNEHNRMVKSKVWVAVDKTDLPPGTVPIDSSWACKKKSDCTLRGRLNARGFK